ncbi:MobF family relaxase [Klenkia taihuensis]|uniref:DNA primase, catalytic core n=1 Tax=Klenkia taihuensis TaxID=1225127 RepID=A0A1I1U5S5_9ACTN|nr:MobF family relaxase [Klenkia taihuensis]GHE06918.1 hypothetical protein GCM10011381_00720 [Klenkia taihuensis]SFD66034.1 DNA primase, catalytic core [Klenkia taihuensis]
MTVHKLTAGDGYAYLSRQVAAQDTTEPTPGGLSSYYTARGEAPGRWMGRGLDGLSGPPLGPEVTEAQMRALFGEGRHPNRTDVERAVVEAGGVPVAAERASRLGAPYRVFPAANEFRRRCAVEYRESNAARGERGTAPVPAEDRARIRTAVATDMFRETFGRDPLDPRELSGHLARLSRQRTTAVAGYDLAFSPVKSVSTLWAIAPRDVAEVIEKAHADAVADVVAWLEDRATYTRTGRDGVAQVDARGLLAAAFTHRDSRAGDPDLHTHVAVSNKVQTIGGRWLALDGRPVYKNTVAASERYNTRIEAFLVERLGVCFADRQDDEPGKRPVREIVGIDGPLPRLWSSRRAAINTRRAVLSAAFQTDHGRPPTAREAIHLAQQANLETREAKHEPLTHAEQRATWRAEALIVLGDKHHLDSYVNNALHRAGGRAGSDITSGWLDQAAQATVDRVGQSRATWNEAHLRAEGERLVRRAGVPARELDLVVDTIVSRAMSPPMSVRLTPMREDGEPAALRRRDGASVFETADSAVHTSDAVLEAERAVIDAAGRFDGHTTPSSAVESALLIAAESGPTLNPGQAGFVRALATSGARVQVAVAPAGTGKTTALRALAIAWRAGGGTVVGLAPTAAASSVLREQLADATDTVAKFVHAAQTGIDPPAWLSSIGPGSLVIVDEAGAATTHDLAAVIATVVAAGGSVRLVGDDHQLAPIGAGGLLADLAAANGAAHLDEVVRFTHAESGEPNAVEGLVSLALREGDPTALAYYADRGRLHVGDLSSCVDQAYDAWAADRTAGLDPLMLAPTRELVRELNLRARDDRLAREGTPSREVDLADGTRASAGDVVISRRNDRTLASGTASWVANGDRWTIAAVRHSGAVDAVHTATAALVTLPPDYVRNHLRLGYATTVHGAQGVTADSSYTVVAGHESRQLLYVALTRGRHTNHAFVTVTGDGDEHSAITRDGVLPPTAVEVLRRVLARNDALRSASSVIAAEDDPEQQLAAEVDRYVHSLGTAAEELVGPGGMAAIDHAAETAVPGLTDEPAYPALRADLALHGAAGHDAPSLLREASVDPRGLDGARDAAAVLDWRIGAPTPDGPPPPLPWLPAIPRAVSDAPTWGDYLGRRARRVHELATAIAEDAESWTPNSAPPWARPLIPDHELVRDLAVWRAAAGVERTDPRPTGAPSSTAADLAAQQGLDDRVRRCVSEATAGAVRWAAQLRDAAPDLINDPFWPVLLDRLVDRRMDDPNGASLVEAVTINPLPDELPAAALWWRLVEHLRLRSPDPAQLAVVEGLDPSPTVDPVVAAPGYGEIGPSRARVLQLNQLAADFFADAYPGSWAQSYLAERLGTDPSNATNHVIGLAPQEWTGLVDYLRRGGASDLELLASGLASRTTRGGVVDRFRDRVMFAIQDDDGIVGWIGRRHPDADTQPHPASPKYLNTAETVAFTKGQQLFGLVESRRDIARGATAVLVEGPLDALAVTMAGAGDFIGVAPLGTAFTEPQAERLLSAVRDDQRGPIVAMDSDDAGRRSAEGIFWRLGTRTEARSLTLPDGEDPAGFLHRAGAPALATALRASPSLAGALVEARMDEFAKDLATVEGQVAATRRAAQVIAATPVTTWAALLTQVVARTGIAPDIALQEALAVGDLLTSPVRHRTAESRDIGELGRESIPRARQAVQQEPGSTRAAPPPRAARCHRLPS